MLLERLLGFGLYLYFKMEKKNNYFSQLIFVTFHYYTTLHFMVSNIIPNSHSVTETKDQKSSNTFRINNYFNKCWH